MFLPCTIKGWKDGHKWDLNPVTDSFLNQSKTKDKVVIYYTNQSKHTTNGYAKATWDLNPDFFTPKCRVITKLQRLQEWQYYCLFCTAHIRKLKGTTGG